MTIVYFRFLGNYRVSLASTAGGLMILVELFPRKSVRSEEFMKFKNISCFPNWYRPGFSLHSLVVFVWGSVPLKSLF